MLIFTETKTYANVYLDSDNNFVIETADKQKTSAIWYQTQGFSISRAVYPAQKVLHPSREFVGEDDMQSKTSIVNVGGIQYNAFRVPLMSLISQGSGAWVKEVEDALNGGPGVWIRFDSIMYVYHGQTRINHPFINTPPVDGQNPAAIQAAENWKNKEGLKSHFNRWIYIGKEKEEEKVFDGMEDVKVADEKTTTNFVWKTGNSSDEYDLGEGIPSSKDVTNEYIASKWWGETEVWARTKTSTSYTGIPYKYSWKLREISYEKQEDGSTKRVENIKEMTPFSGTFDEKIKGINTSMVPAVAFEYLVDANFYDLAVTGAYNLAYPGTIYYDSEYDVPMTALTTRLFVDISNEEIGKEKIASWYADDAKHIKWASRPDGAEQDLGVFDDEESARRAYEAQYLSDRNDKQTQIANNTYTWNDYLKIDGKEYLKGGTAHQVAGVNWTENGEKPPYTFCTNSAARRKPFVVGSIKDVDMGTETGEETVTIPAETDNGKYPTGLECFYTRKLKNDSYAKIFRAGSEWFASFADGTYYGELTDGHCLDSYAGYINVHTPVITPIDIQNDQGVAVGNDETQLAASKVNDHAQKQMILDETYMIDWEPFVHRDIMNYGYSGDPSKYDEFVKRKWMRFPFCVEYDGKFYDIDSGEGEGKYTKWILVKAPNSWKDDVGLEKASDSNGWYPKVNNHWKLTPFYIPPYAIECGEPGNDVNIQVKVEALNVDGRYGGDHSGEQQENANTDYTYEYADDGAKYVARIYNYPVQLSGQIYDFIITGDSDKNTFRYEDTNGKVDIGDSVPFCYYKEEKRVGTKNRYGSIDPSNVYDGTAVRYRADGSLTRNWSLTNTLPLMQGKSNYWTGMGYAIKGSTFSFSFKTMANLWDFEKNANNTDVGGLYSVDTDKVIITPTFRYIYPDGTEVSQYDASGKEQLKIYYNAAKTDNIFVEYGSRQDNEEANIWTVALTDKQFRKSYYDDTQTTIRDGKTWQFGDWINYTVSKENESSGKTGSAALTAEEFMNRTTYSYSLSKIVLDSRLRFLSGEWEELKRNICGNGRAYDGNTTPAYKKLLRLEDVTYDTYNGYVDGTPDYTRGESNWDAAKEDAFRKSMQTWYGQYHIPSDLYIVDLKKHGYDENFKLTSYATAANGGRGIQADDKIFEQGGYLVINFKIETINNGQKHLIYNGGYDGAKDMWEKEGFKKNVTLTNGVGENPINVELKSGDVAIVDMTKSVEDYYSQAIFNIN